VAASSPPRDTALLAAAELERRVVSVGMWLWLAADTFFFAAWWFSFFYLKALNNNQDWRPQGVDAPALGFGIIVLALVILMAASLWVMTRVAPRSFLFSLLTPVSLVFGIAACLFQGYGMWHLGFGLTQGGYAAVFAGLTGAWLVQVLGATVWLATVAIQTREGGDTLLRAHAAATFAWFPVYLSLIGVINFILLYLVK
jgi:heme/copper-type cytochrome/quinol oxidase subunit 3